MGYFKVTPKDLFFILKDQLNYGTLCSLDRYKDLNEKTLDMLVTEAINYARGVVDPLQEIGEQWGVKFEKGKIYSPPEFKKAFQQYGEDGWISASRDIEYGGQGFPNIMRIVVDDLMCGACMSFTLATTLTHSTAHLIESFATEELKKIYVQKMFRGDWSGTMCFTEADAGSNLAGCQTTAFPEGNHFKIKGSKIFITWGNQDMTENIIHLVLARIDGAPEGSRGISLFIVPKVRINPDGSLGEANDVICDSVEEKIGLHASPTCALSFGANDGCIGYLCGKENQSLSSIFHMMNLSRINAGIAAMALGSCAYLNALDYARERVQGRDLSGRKAGGVTIINHPDVRRMLIDMKVAVDGMRSMIYTVAFWLDLALELPDGNKKTHYQNLVDFMTPIIKAYCSDIGFEVCVTALQCFGGYGFCKDVPIEQYLRDSKIMSIYGGTNGIQSMDLMGRKMNRNGGVAFNAFRTEIEKFCESNREHAVIGEKVRSLSGVWKHICEMALELSGRMKTDPLQWASYTYPAMMCLSEITMTWRLLDMAIIAQKIIGKAKGKKGDYLRNKVIQASYYTDVTLPQTLARAEICMRSGREIVEMPERAF